VSCHMRRRVAFMRVLVRYLADYRKHVVLIGE
jgi:hypothetical protein